MREVRELCRTKGSHASGCCHDEPGIGEHICSCANPQTVHMRLESPHWIRLNDTHLRIHRLRMLCNPAPDIAVANHDQAAARNLPTTHL